MLVNIENWNFGENIDGSDHSSCLDFSSEMIFHQAIVEVF